MAEGRQDTEAEKKVDAAKNKDAAGTKPKKKRLIAVFHPQNASTKEAKTFRQGGGKQKSAKATKPLPSAAATERSAEKRPAAEASRGGKPVGNRRKPAGTPLVHVPRSHGIVRDENENKPTMPAPAPKKKVEEAPKPAAAEAVKAEAAGAKAPAATAAAEAAKAAPSPATPARSSFDGRTNRNESQGDRRRNGGERSDGRREARTGEGQRRGSDNRAPREGGARQGGASGSRNGSSGSRDGGNRSGFGNRDGGGRGTRQGSGNGSRSGFGSRDGGNRSGFGGSSRAGAPGGNRTGFGGRSANRPAAGAAMDVSVKKPARDNHSHDKDKNKQDLRSNRFSDGKSGGNGNRNNNNRHLIPKALQRPVHHRDEKKEEKVTEIKIPDKLTIRELAEKMKMQPSIIVKDLFMKGEMFTVNQEVNYEKAEEIAMTYEILCDHEETVDVIAEMLKEDEEDTSTMVSRPPVVCVMGHVDHGKTSLLDAIRHAHVTEKEAGGITQNIGAYVVSIDGRRITFLDTPGHEAFTAMRMRGANSTDIAVLVVAADDGVMPQTIEAINHAKAAGVEIIVAINKIDKPGANVDRVKQELTEYGLVATDWGGQTEMVEVSAKTKTGIDDLLETILLTADIMELSANPNRLARGLVLEAKLDKGKGPVANLLIQKGTLHVGDYIACGAASGKVRAMMDDTGRRVKTAGPSTPVEVQGLSGVPDAGETLVAMETDKEAKAFAATYVTEHKNQLLEETKSRMSLDALFGQIQDGSVKELEIIVKADVQGSVEALKQSLLKLSNDEVVVKIIHGGVGAINESDISLAAASNAIIIGFNVRPDQTAKSLADEEKVDVRLYRVIYQAIEDIENAMKGMREPIYEEKIIGHAEIRQLFKASGVGTIAGSMVLDGVIQRGCKCRITRGKDQIFDGPLASLKRFKDDVKEVRSGYECGLVFDGFNGIQEFDQVEAYAMVEVPR